jgi:phage shock protein PspC (stress-responsive transcriptional regulator)
VAGTSPERVLRRSQEDFYLLGVCGGFGRYLGTDPGWFRVGLILLPPLWLLYLVTPLVMPVERLGDELGPPTRRMRKRAESHARHGGGMGAAAGGAVRRHVLRKT